MGIHMQRFKEDLPCPEQELGQSVVSITLRKSSMTQIYTQKQREISEMVRNGEYEPRGLKRHVYMYISYIQ